MHVFFVVSQNRLSCGCKNHVKPFRCRCLTSKLRHSRRKPAWPAMMMFEFHGSVKAEGAAAVACSDLLAGDGQCRQRYRTSRTDITANGKKQSSISQEFIVSL